MRSTLPAAAAEIVAVWGRESTPFSGSFTVMVRGATVTVLVSTGSGPRWPSRPRPTIATNAIAMMAMRQRTLDQSFLMPLPRDSSYGRRQRSSRLLQIGDRQHVGHLRIEQVSSSHEICVLGGRDIGLAVHADSVLGGGDIRRLTGDDRVLGGQREIGPVLEEPAHRSSTSIKRCAGSS